MNTFDLKNYVPQIVAMAEATKCTATEAVDHFVTNLTTMSDFHKGADTLNFRALGQQWNALNYKIRNSQKAETVDLVAKKMLPPARSRKGL